MNDTRKPDSPTASRSTPEGFTDEERAAMKERAKELRTAAKRGPKATAGDQAAEVLATIAAMSESDRAIAERLHAIIAANAPGLSPKLWYGMPAYAKDGKVVCFYQPADKFKTRYSTFAFNDVAKLDDGAMWPTAFALTALTVANETMIAELVKRAAG